VIHRQQQKWTSVCSHTTKMGTTTILFTHKKIGHSHHLLKTILFNEMMVMF